MLLDIILMIGAYTIVRLLSLLTRTGSTKENIVVRILAVPAIILIGSICFTLLSQDTNSNTDSILKTSSNSEVFQNQIVELQIDTSPEKQSERIDVIDYCTSEQFFHTIEIVNGLPELTVGPQFKSLSLNVKRGFVRSVYGYHYTVDKRRNVLLIRDYSSGKAIGKMDKFGLHLN